MLAAGSLPLSSETGVYGDVAEYESQDSVAPLRFPDLTIRLRALD